MFYTFVEACLLQEEEVGLRIFGNRGAYGRRFRWPVMAFYMTRAFGVHVKIIGGFVVDCTLRRVHPLGAYNAQAYKRDCQRFRIRRP